jgi:hypothetical protein
MDNSNVFKYFHNFVYSNFCKHGDQQLERRLVILSDVNSTYFAILIRAEVLRIERIPLTGSRQMLRHNQRPKDSSMPASYSTLAAEPDTPDLPVPQFEQEAP